MSQKWINSMGQQTLTGQLSLPYEWEEDVK